MLRFHRLRRVRRPGRRGKGSFDDERRVVVYFSKATVGGSCVRVFEDNQGANSPSRSKLIDVRFHLARGRLRGKKIGNQFLSSGEQRADIPTKSLTATLFKSHRMFFT